MDHSYAQAYPELYRNHWWWRTRERILLRELDALLEGRFNAARILDIGCGAGLFFDALKRFGTVEGLESDSTAIAQSGAWRDRIHQGYLDDSFQPTGRYDVVLMLDVLEHVEDPEDVLRRTRDLLAVGGRIVITVPAFRWLWTRHDDLNHHLRRYTTRELSGSLIRAGLHPVRSRYLFHSLVPLKLGVRVVERMMASKPEVPTIPGRRMNGLIQSWLDLEFRIAGRIPVGSSILMIAEADAGSATMAPA